MTQPTVSKHTEVYNIAYEQCSWYVSSNKAWRQFAVTGRWHMQLAGDNGNGSTYRTK